MIGIPLRSTTMVDRDRPNLKKIMNHLYRISTTTSLRRLHLNTSALAALIVSVCHATSVTADQVSHVFDASITSIIKSGDTDFELPVEITVGKSIRGQFEFEPVAFGPIVGTQIPIQQENGLRFTIDSMILSSTTYLTTIMNDGFLGVAGSEPLGPFDIIKVECRNTASCSPIPVTGPDALAWQSLLRFGDNPSVLDQMELPGDPAVWNQFAKRSLELDFSQINGSGHIRIIAAVGPLRSAPEPISLEMATMFAGFLILRCRRRKAPFKSS